jgi:hypothetical protein
MIDEYWDVYIDGVFTKRIHYFGYFQAFTKEHECTYIKGALK